jgi:hypothetical protein
MTRAMILLALTRHTNGIRKKTWRNLTIGNNLLFMHTLVSNQNIFISEGAYSK